MFLRDERNLTPEEADLLRGHIEVRRASFRHTAGCNSGCALFALAFGALLVSRLSVPDRWELSDVANTFLKIAGVLICLLAMATMVKEFFKTQIERRRFEREEVQRIEEAVRAGDVIAYTVTTDDVILIEGVDEDLFTTYVSLGAHGTLVVPGEIEPRGGVWPAREFTLVTSPHYGDWQTVESGATAPARVGRVPVETLPQNFNLIEPREMAILPGTPEEVLRRLGYDCPIQVIAGG